MDKNSIIDKKTFDICLHAEDHPDVFICDKVIAPCVSLLNKKGYKTFSSCSGHYLIEFYEYFNEDLSNLEEFKKNKRIIIKNINDNSFDYWIEKDKTLLYVLFDDEYQFNDLPSDFTLSINNGLDYPRTCIECEISYYNDLDEHRTRVDVLSEIDSKCKLLEEWINRLPNNKKKI